MKALVYLATSAQGVKRSSLEVLTRCCDIPAITSIDVVSIGYDVTSVRDAANAYPVGSVYLVEHPGYSIHSNANFLDAIEGVVQQCDPAIIAFASTEQVKDILGALAIRVDGTAIPDVASFDVKEDGVTAIRPVMAAKKLARVSTESNRVIVSVRSGSYNAETRAESNEPKVFAVATTPRDTETVKEIATALDEIDLSDARVIVSAGRGVRDDAGKKLVDDLAALLGAGKGATRAVVETGMFPATAQIGQTGKVVSPELYFAIGLSGAIQHVAGMANSKTIVAINKDPDAPIFQVATYGIVGDLYEVLPELIAHLKTAIPS